jgi:hypothetical protein
MIWRELGMRAPSVGDLTITSIIERVGPWRRPENMFPAYDPEVGRRPLAEMDARVFDFNVRKNDNCLSNLYGPSLGSRSRRDFFAEVAGTAKPILPFHFPHLAAGFIDADGDSDDLLFGLFLCQEIDSLILRSGSLLVLSQE